MPWWILECPRCKQEFPYSEISSHDSMPDTFAGVDLKPKFPDGGLRLSCPNCGQLSSYQRYELIYRVTLGTPKKKSASPDK
jgi:hypothetical protein